MRNPFAEKPDTIDNRVDNFARHLKIAANLIGNDPESVDPEYIRAMAEFTLQLSGLGGEHSDPVQGLLIAMTENAS